MLLRSQKESTPPSSEAQQPPVSVIICARNEAANLRDYLHIWLNQDYPEYEVIIIDDGSVDQTRQIVEYWQKHYSHLRLTFVPAGAKVRSTKKLAITLGVKAAKYDHLLLTDADCCPASRHWISAMMRQHNFPIILGAGMYFRRGGLLNRLIQYQTLFTALQYLGMARAGHPYMGVGRNLAYTKQLFVEHNGFSGLLDYRSGDDDLFVNRLASADNTTIVTCAESLTWSAPKRTWKEWLTQRRRHLSVAHAYRHTTQFRLSVEPVTRGLLYGTALTLLVIGAPVIQNATAAALVLRWLVQIIVINYAAYKWQVTKSILMLPVWDITMPLITLYIMLTQPILSATRRSSGLRGYE